MSKSIKIITTPDELRCNGYDGFYNVWYRDADGKPRIAKFNTTKDALFFINIFNNANRTTEDKPEVVTALSDFAKIAGGIASVLEEKNKRYGNSALKPISIFNGKSKVGQRADDKVARIMNSQELRKNDVCDLIGYLILMCKENEWYDFTDQID